MSGKPVAEQEIGHALLQEVVAFAETSISRRKFILHYFGEEFDTSTGEGGHMDDNMRNPKTKQEAQNQAQKLLDIINQTNEQYKSKDVVNVIVGNANALIKSHRTDKQPFFGLGVAYQDHYWMALLRQLLVAKYIRKDIETYGVIKLTQKGLAYIKNPVSFMMTEDHSFKQANDDAIVIANKGGGVVADAGLFKLLKAELKATADSLSLPPYVIFQEPSLQDMALKYPISIEELSNVHGVGEGKAKKYGKNFVALIKKYVDENDIERPDDLVVKSTGSNSANKLYIIQNVDRKLPLTDIADSKGLPMEELIKQMEAIVYSGTKLDISYWVDEILDEDQQEDIHEYFLESHTDKIDDAMQEFDGEYDDEELRIYRIKFINEVAN